jgi:hypothetical protein
LRKFDWAIQSEIQKSPAQIFIFASFSIWRALLPRSELTQSQSVSLIPGAVLSSPSERRSLRLQSLLLSKAKAG